MIIPPFGCFPFPVSLPNFPTGVFCTSQTNSLCQNSCLRVYFWRNPTKTWLGLEHHLGLAPRQQPEVITRLRDERLIMWRALDHGPQSAVQDVLNSVWFFHVSQKVYEMLAMKCSFQFPASCPSFTCGTEIFRKIMDKTSFGPRIKL